MVLSALVKYWYILHYHKCKVEYIELRVIKVVLIIIIKGKFFFLLVCYYGKEKKVINIVLKSEMAQLF